ncbi:MAG: hypothetical protein ACI976_002740 [Aureispira sp.]|jgi:hypothetical protein
MKTKSRYLIIVCFILSSQITILIAQPSFTLNGSTIVMSENCYRLTSHESSNDVGSLWCEFPIDLANAIDLRFAINLGCSKYAGEGIAFVMHTDSASYDALGCDGSVMGFGKGSNCDAISPSFALEIDTRFNRNHKDLYQPHLALVQDGNLGKPLTEPIRAKEYGKDVRDCEYHDVQITWLPSKQELCIYFDGELRITYGKDLVDEIFAGEQNVYFGFTGSTSSRANMQMICVQSLVIEVDGDFERKRSFEDAIGIYPNPLKEKITISVDLSEEQDVQMQLYDSTGKLIYEIPTHATQAKKYYFNMPGLPSGVYYVTVTNGTNRVSKKIVHISSIRA